MIKIDMTSYHGADTAKVQNDLRRQAKRRQSRGTGAHKPQHDQVDYKEAMRNTPRHFNAILDSTLVNDIAYWSANNNRIVTNYQFRKWFNENMNISETENGGRDLIVILDGENAKIMNGEGTKIKITKNGFFLQDGSPSPVVIWSITFRLGKNDIIGFQARWDNERNTMFIN